MLKLTTIQKNEFSRCVADLTQLWLSWINDHHKSNDPANSMQFRRQAGVNQQQLQRDRQAIIKRIDTLFDERH